MTIILIVCIVILSVGVLAYLGGIPGGAIAFSLILTVVLMLNIIRYKTKQIRKQYGYTASYFSISVQSLYPLKSERAKFDIDGTAEESVLLCKIGTDAFISEMDRLRSTELLDSTTVTLFGFEGYFRENYKALSKLGKQTLKLYASKRGIIVTKD